jgi:CheY-like chemotaxis protein
MGAKRWRSSRLRPDIVLMDMAMPEMDGLTATQALRSLAPECQVIILTIHDDETSRKRAREAGAAGFVCKCDDETLLCETIRSLDITSIKNKEKNMLIIRPETPQDIPLIYRVNQLAFARDNEADLVDRLRRENAITLSLVAVQDEQVVGHILITPVTVQAEDSQWNAVALGPMAVLPSHQKQGVGSALIRAAFEELKKMGISLSSCLGIQSIIRAWDLSVQAAGHSLGKRCARGGVHGGGIEGRRAERQDGDCPLSSRVQWSVDSEKIHLP